MSDFKLFLDGSVIKFREKLMELSKNEHLGKLYFDKLGDSRFRKLAWVALVLILSHGQASVERGFSQPSSTDTWPWLSVKIKATTDASFFNLETPTVSKYCLSIQSSFGNSINTGSWSSAVERGFSQNISLIQVNMSPNTMICKRIIKNHVLANNLKPYTITIDSPIMKAFRSARVTYKEYLDPGPPDVIRYWKLCSKGSTREQTIKMLDTDFIQCIKSAEEKNGMSLVKKKNALKCKSEKAKSELHTLLNEVMKRRKLLHQ